MYKNTLTSAGTLTRATSFEICIKLSILYQRKEGKKMKKINTVLFLLFSGVLLGACSNSTTPDTTSESQNTSETETVVSVPETVEKEVYFDGETLKIEMATLNILSYEVLVPDESVYRDNNQIAFVFEVTNDDDEPLDGSMVWIACMEAFQETENTVGLLDVGMTPQDDKFEEYRGGEFDDLKPGGTRQYVIAYDLNDTETPIVLKATQGIGGQALGEKTFILE